MFFCAYTISSPPLFHLSQISWNSATPRPASPSEFTRRDSRVPVVPPPRHLLSDYPLANDRHRILQEFIPQKITETIKKKSRRRSLFIARVFSNSSHVELLFCLKKKIFSLINFLAQYKKKRFSLNSHRKTRF